MLEKPIKTVQFCICQFGTNAKIKSFILSHSLFPLHPLQNAALVVTGSKICSSDAYLLYHNFLWLLSKGGHLAICISIQQQQKHNSFFTCLCAWALFSITLHSGWYWCRGVWMVKQPLRIEFRWGSWEGGLITHKHTYTHTALWRRQAKITNTFMQLVFSLLHHVCVCAFPCKCVYVKEERMTHMLQRSKETKEKPPHRNKEGEARCQKTEPTSHHK